VGVTFRGESLHKVDSKGRVSIPAGFRRVLEAGDPDCSPGQPPRVAVAYGDRSGRRLECFTIDEMNALGARIRSLPRKDPRREPLTELYVRNVVELTRAPFAIEGEARFVAELDHFEIWSPEKYAGKQARIEAVLEEMDQADDPLALLDDVPDPEA
jgi:MraZ protein